MSIAESARPVAAVDIGSGAVKLLVTGPAGLLSREAELAHASVKTKLLAGGGGRISEQALVATAAAFDHFVELMAPHQPLEVVVVGTAWARTVSNLDALERVVIDKFGVTLEVLSGDREAELSFLGATAGRNLSGPVSVMDLGAGSTEYCLQVDGGPLRTMSLPIGGRNLTDQYLASDPPLPEELSSALSIVALHLDDLRREIPDFGEAVDTGTVIGVGATSQIGEVEIGFADPDNESVDGYRLSKPALEEVFRALATESAAERMGNPGLRPQDVDDVVGAMCIAVGFMRGFEAEAILLSERGLKHGLAADLLAKR